MTRGILIAGTESSLSAAIAAEAGKRVEQAAVACIPSHIAGQGPERPLPFAGGPNLIALRWNPGSPISARALTLAAVNRLGHIDNAVLVCTPPSVRRQAADLNPGEIETIIDDYVKGWFFLVKELTLHMKTRGTGTLAMVLSGAGIAGLRDDVVDLMGPSVVASFSSFAQGLLASSFGKPYHTLAFFSETGEDAPFASFIFKHIDEGSKRSSGKWFKYGRLGIFGR
jgi:NAD(P)-dependent dehydrogenase (short-subunit alcohol dehydrogenase family)